MNNVRPKARFERAFVNKTAIVTGGSSGIGRSLAVRLARAGSNVLIVARREGPIRETLDLLERYRASAPQVFRGYSLDVGDHTAVDRVSAEILADYNVDLLINNAGVAYAETIEKTPRQVFEEMFRINYLGTVWMTLALIPHFKARRSGQIVNVASLAGVLGFFGYAAYAPSKFAVVGFSEVIRNELRPIGIRVSLVLPPDTDTPQLAAENRTKPPETRAIGGTAGILDPDYVARCVLRAAASGRFVAVPGLAGKFPYYASRWFPSFTRWLIDREVRAFQVRR
jgi:3-dehydrosphinganine reductase